MKTLIELNIPQIKCENKESTDYLRDMQKRANDELFKYRNRPLSPRATEALINVLTDIGVSLKNSIVTGKRAARRDEIMAQLRANIKALKSYLTNFQWEQDDISKAQKILNYQVKKTLEMNINTSDDDIINQLYERKEIENYYVIPMFNAGINLETNNFNRTANDLLNLLYNKYAIDSKEPLKIKPLPLQKEKQEFKRVYNH